MNYQFLVVLSTLMCLIAAGMTAGARADEPEFAIIGYLPEYRVADVSAQRLRGKITDLIYFGLEPPADGRLPDVPVDAAILKKLHETKRVCRCRLLISVGGWNRSAGFPALAASDTARDRLVAGLLVFCRREGFDGIDYDWEHPQGERQLADYGRLVAATKRAAAPRQLLVTVAQAPWQDLGKPIYETVDRVHLMSYDHDFPQATLAKSKADVEQLIAWGCPPAKIALGLPCYGRNERGETRAYRDLAAQGKLDPRTDLVDGFAFNGPATVAAKVEFAIGQSCGGVMIWELGQDAVAENAALLEVIRERVEGNARR